MFVSDVIDGQRWDPTTATIHSGRDILPAFAVLIGVFNAVTPAYLH